MVRILITGFEPFDGERVNPSHEAGVRLAGVGIDGADCHYLRLPVERFRAVELAVAELRRLRPDAVIALGQAGGRARITPERIAINVDDFRIPDNGGAQPRDQAHVEDGPAAYLCTLPVRAMTEAIVAAGVPAAISNTAGTFLCNHIAYGLLHAAATKRWRTLVGFVHVPYLPEQAAPKRLETPSMALTTLLDGLRAGIGAVVKQLAAGVAKAGVTAGGDAG